VTVHTVQFTTSADTRALFEEALESAGCAVSAEEIAGGRFRMSGFISGKIDPTQLTQAVRAAAAAGKVRAPKLVFGRLGRTDWTKKARKPAPPVRAGAFLVHERRWRGAKRPKIGIAVDAGLAFGSGRHETTRGILTMLSRLRARRFGQALDMGTGSGILAIAIAKLWDIPVLACDNDPVAVATARENARLNRAKQVKTLRSDGYAAADIARHAPFDLIVANILAKPLTAMAADLARHLAPGGVALLSGIEAHEDRAVAAAHTEHGLRRAGRLVLDGWSTVMLTKPADKRIRRRNVRRRITASTTFDD
jgi:ribosomal protein L11 methyltransferase